MIKVSITSSFVSKISLITAVIVWMELPVMAQLWSDITEIHNDPSLGFTRPRIGVTNGDTAVVMWSKKSNQHVYVTKESTNGFNTPKRLNPGGMTVFAQDWAGPEMAANGKHVIVVFKSQPENTGLPFASISHDGGTTFSDTVRVTSDIWSRFPTPAIDNNGKPYVAFMAFDSGFADPHYVVSTSTNNGLSFNLDISGSAPAPGEVCDCCPANIQANTSDVSLFFRNNDNNIRDLWMAVSNNSGVSFSIRADVDENNWNIFSCPSTGPDALLTNDSAIFVWMSGASGSSRVYLGTSDIAGINIGRNILLDNTISSNANQNYPRIAGSGDTIGVIWQESFQGKIHIKGRFSITGIEGLLSAVVDTINDPAEPAQMNPDIAFHNAAFHMVWSNNFAKRILYRKLNLNIETGIGALYANGPIKIYPNPANSEIHLDGIHSTENAELHIIDASGKKVIHHDEVKHNRVIDISGLMPGLYTLLITDHTDTRTIRFVVL